MTTLYVGIDVSAKTLHVATSSRRLRPRTVDNTESGRRSLRRWLEARNVPVRVTVEPTGLYSLDTAIELSESARIEVMMPNPRAVQSFGKATMLRSKTDSDDAVMLVKFGQQMPFRPWTPPPAKLMQARALSRAVIAMGKDKARLRTRLHAATRTGTVPDILVDELQQAIKDIAARQSRLRKAAIGLLCAEPQVARQYEAVRSLPGVAEGHAITLTCELSPLPADMTARQWTAHAGLDPTEHSSGSSVRQRPRISRRGNARLRQSLYLASLVAAIHNERVKRVHARLVDRGKTINQAHCAVMRKYLHVIHAMWRSGTKWDESRFGA